MGAVLGIHAPKSLVWDAAESAAPDFAFHPVRDWLTGLAWDGTPRLASWLADYFGAEPSPLHSAMGRAWTISAVARAFRPGCKADYLLVIEGPQGRKKSTGLAALVGADWFSDDFDASLLGDKDAVAKLRSKWVVEMPEAVAVRRSDVDALKGYLSRTTDRVRLPYQRRAADFPRQSVFCSTTNQTQYLADATGARRFWCVRGLVRYPEVRRDEIAAAREQLWAEAVAAFKAGEPWYLPAEIESGAAESAAARYVADSWEPRIAHWLTVAKPTAPTVLDVWHALAPSSKGDVVALDPARAARIRAVMVRLGWEVSGAGFRLDF
jgi:predicted P-loop ATPase